MELPRTLRQLETALGFFGYYRKFVAHFAAIASPLVKLKTEGFRGGPIKGKPRQRHAENSLLQDLPTKPSESPTDKPALLSYTNEQKYAWETLKQSLCNAPTLAFPDFHKPFLLYTDGSKEMGFGAALH